MPRRRSMTGRSERNLHTAYMRRYRRPRRNISEINELIVNELIDSYKCGLDAVPSGFITFSLGEMNNFCVLCGAKHFKSEMTGRDNDKFTICCHKGKTALPPLTQNTFFQKLCEGINSTNASIKQRSANYLENIRSYNAAFAMVSSECQIAESIMNGVYHFKIHDVFYHRAGALAPRYPQQPCYAQLYFYDVETAVQYRMSKRANQSCHSNLMLEIANELDRKNTFVQSFRSMATFCERPENAAAEVCMLIKVNNTVDLRRYNDAVSTDVAAIFKSVDGEPPFERNIVVFSKNSNVMRTVSVLDSSLDPLAYPLLFPNGDTGWHPYMIHNIASTSNAAIPRNKITMLQYASYRLAIRNDFSILHNSQKLFLQWIVDIYVRIEGSRLNFMRLNQANLRSEVYNNLVDFLAQPNENEQRIGQRVVLPSTFIGSPRNMFQNYLDAMSIVQHFGKPSLFITMTCNPNWPEIRNNLPLCKSSNFRPEIVVRVFKNKLDELVDSLIKKEIFGKVEALIYTIEFQKRGLPHAHILLTLKPQDRIEGTVVIDKIVSAEIPDIDTDTKLHHFVKSHMIHGPCGALNPNSICMKDAKCTKKFPKDFTETTYDNVNGYPAYKRRDNGRTVNVRGSTVDNRYVVPYNPYLLAKFDCHLNVEICTTVQSVKYIYKYVYKGYDCASLEIGQVNQTENAGVQIDEIQEFVSGRYIGSTEAAWRIFEYPMHYQTHTIMRLPIHLPEQQNIYFREGNEQQAVAVFRSTKLLAFFQLNIIDQSANQYLYTEIPSHYVWNDSDKKWTKRMRRGYKTISRLYVISPRKIELFYMRMLLLHVRGPKNFEDLRKYDGVTHPTFIAACHARGIASNDNEWQACLEEAKDINSPRQLRELFGFICAMNVPPNALALWNHFKNHLSEDFMRDFCEDVAFNKSLSIIDDILSSHNLSCDQLGLPTPRFIPNNSTTIDIEQEELLFAAMYQNANSEQRNIIDNVMEEVLYHSTGSNVFCLTAHAGCGKTFVQTALIHKINSINLQCIPCAFSGIASTLLIGGRTLHNVFKLPINLVENSVCSIKPNSSQAQKIKNSSLIIIDEISMCPIYAIKAIDRLLKDLCKNEKLFGGKTILMCGDFRQTLPVISHATRVSLIENSIKSWPEFSKFHKVTLTENMRVHQNEIEFVEFLCKLGNGEMQTHPQLGSDIIQLPQNSVRESSTIIEDIYGNVSETIPTLRLLNSVILAPKNDDCAFVNNEILDRMPGEKKTYFSCDKIVSDDIREHNNYPIEFLNSLSVSGIPPHNLALKENCIVLLIRNLNTGKSLVNGTRMRVIRMNRNTLDCEVLTGNAKNIRILIPRIHLTYSGALLPFSFQRTQFPVIPAFAMTINKSQGQTFQNVAILLREPVFSHGQLYVAASRVRSFDGLRFYVSDTSEQGRLLNDDRIYTKNIVYKEVLNF